MRRDVEVRLRLTDEEAAKVDARADAEGLSRAAWMRMVLLRTIRTGTGDPDRRDG